MDSLRRTEELTVGGNERRPRTRKRLAERTDESDPPGDHFDRLVGTCRSRVCSPVREKALTGQPLAVGDGHPPVAASDDAGMTGQETVDDADTGSQRANVGVSRRPDAIEHDVIGHAAGARPRGVWGAPSDRTPVDAASREGDRQGEGGYRRDPGSHLTNLRAPGTQKSEPPTTMPPERATWAT